MVRPFLLDKVNQSFPDPSQFKVKDEWEYAAMVASVFKKVGSEFINWLENHREVVKFLNKKQRGEVTDDFQIGK